MHAITLVVSGLVLTSVIAAQPPRPQPALPGVDPAGPAPAPVTTVADPTPTAVPEQATWPSFRGAHACGVADGRPTPVTWDVAKGSNLRWSTPIAGLAHSSPVVWGDRIYLTTAVRDGEGEQELKVGLYGSIEPVEDDAPYALQVLAIDARTGQVEWSRTAWSGVPAIKRHPKGSHAASTPATDGACVVAFFGSEGLYCFEANGEPRWQVEFGVLDSGFYMMPNAQWGFASSPVIHDDRVYVQCDVQGQSFIAALDLATGKEVWRTDRDEVPTWSTPTVHLGEDRNQLIVNGWKHMGGYDLATGKALWWLAGGGDIPVPTPVFGETMVYLTSAHGRKSPVLAISLDAEGELSLDPEASDYVVWGIERGGNYMQTPVLYRGHLYCCRDNGSLTCFDAISGEQLYTERIGGGGVGFTASGVAADGKLYFTSEEGEVYVVRAGPEYEELAKNELGEICMASPAIADGVLYFRSRGHLTAIAIDR